VRRLSVILTHSRHQAFRKSIPMLGTAYRKHVRERWQDVKKESLSDELHEFRRKIRQSLKDLTLCASMEPETHLLSRSPVENVLGEEAIKPFLMALLDQRDPHEKSKRVESKEERAARIQRQRRLGALLVEIGAGECLKWVPRGAIGDSAMRDAIRGRNVLMEFGGIIQD